MERLEIPVVGIGAGPATDGQVLVFHDLLGIREGHGARFVKRYADLLDANDRRRAPLRRGRARGPLPAARPHLLDRSRGVRRIPQAARGLHGGAYDLMTDDWPFT